MKLALILLLLMALAVMVRLGEPALPRCPRGHVAHERCLP